MNRKDFIRNSAIIGGATILPVNNVFSQNVSENGMDKLVDGNGNFIHRPLNYKKSFLEPFMDEETLHLHYEFHHGGAVDGANKDLENIKKQLMLKLKELLLNKLNRKKNSKKIIQDHMRLNEEELMIQLLN